MKPNSKSNQPMTIADMQAEINRKQRERDEEHKGRPTNIDKVVDYMTFGSPMRQIFVMEALRRYATDILADKDATRKQCEKTFINGDALIEVAENWKDLNPEQF